MDSSSLGLKATCGLIMNLDQEGSQLVLSGKLVLLDSKVAAIAARLGGLEAQVNRLLNVVLWSFAATVLFCAITVGLTLWP